MAVPKKHTTSSKRNQRRSQISLKGASLIECDHCGRLKTPHTVCPYCGYYKKVEVIDVLSKLKRKERKEKEKEIKQKEKEGKQSEPLTMEKLSKEKF